MTTWDAAKGCLSVQQTGSCMKCVPVYKETKTNRVETIYHKADVAILLSHMHLHQMSRK